VNDDLNSDSGSRRRSDDPFGSTRWSLVLAAGQEGTAALEALQTLCQTYWLPVYGYVRRRAANADDAQDLTQAFFAMLLEHRTFGAADPACGRFRAFLLTALRNFLANEHDRANAVKRGGGRPAISLDAGAAEQYLARDALRPSTPEQEFERRWALALLDRVIERLADEQTAAGRLTEFEALRLFLTGQAPETTQADVARQLGMTEEAVRAAIYRLRKRYRTLLRDEIAQTVSSAEEVDEELQRLFEALGS
jgi:RNA polymerase sigma-70 factor (ECF subfamily)